MKSKTLSARPRISETVRTMSIAERPVFLLYNFSNLEGSSVPSSSPARAAERIIVFVPVIILVINMIKPLINGILSIGLFFSF